MLFVEFSILCYEFSYFAKNRMYEDLISFYTVQKMKYSIKDFFSKYDQIRSFLQIWSHLPNKSLMENFVFLCSVRKLTVRKWICYINCDYFLECLYIYFAFVFPNKINSKYRNSITLIVHVMETVGRDFFLLMFPK